MDERRIERKRIPSLLSLVCFLRYSLTRVVRSFFSFPDQTPPPSLFSHFFLPFFPLFLSFLPLFSTPRSPDSLFVSRTTRLTSSGYQTSLSILFFPFTRLPTRTAFYHVPSLLTHPPRPSRFTFRQRRQRRRRRSPRRRATRVHGTRIMEVFSAKVKLSG